MISEAEVRREAARLGVDLMIVDLDYVLGCFLATLFRDPKASALCFKGGTCLKKCYYADYRFSEDLDFTLTRRLSQAEIENWLAAVATQAEDDWEIDFRVRPIRVKLVDDDYGKESYHVRLYYDGPLRRRGDPRAIRLDFTTREVVAFPIDERSISHGYSDAGQLSEVRVPCYGLLEMVAEKVRALGGQRTHAISRDVYDVYQLSMRSDVDLPRLVAALPEKWEVKGLAAQINVEKVLGRRDEFRDDWERNLLHLLPSAATVEFDEVWNSTKTFLAKIGRALRDDDDDGGKDDDGDNCRAPHNQDQPSG